MLKVFRKLKSIRDSLARNTSTVLVSLLIMADLSAGELPVKFKHLTSADGLSQNSVYAILEDSQGFMWFGTRFGLNRYDGEIFRSFLFDPLDQNSLPSYFVFCLIEDQAGNIWVGTANGGISMFSKRYENFVNFQHDPTNDNSLISDFVTCLYEDSEGDIWIGTENGLSKFNPSSGLFTNFRHIDGDSTSLCQERIASLAEIPDGTLWVGTENGSLMKISLDDNSIKTRFDESLSSNMASSVKLRSLKADTTSNVLWLGQFGAGLFKMDISSEQMTYYGSEDNRGLADLNGVYSISQQKNGILWLGTVGGVTRMNPKAETFKYYHHDPNDPSSLGDNQVYAIYVDRQGIVWVGTETNGVNIYDPGLIRFGHKRVEPGNENSIRSNGVFSLSKDFRGNIWFGTLNGGTSVMDSKTGSFSHYFTEDKDPSAWSRNYMARVRPDRDRTVWFGSFECGLYSLDYPTGIFTHYLHNEDDSLSFSDKTVKDILQTQDGTIWIATETQGLERFNAEDGSFSHYKRDPQNPKSISSNFGYCLLEDQAGFIWIGTPDKGLNRFDRSTGIFTHYQVDLAGGSSLSSNCILSLHEDQQNNLWIGTRSGGLNKLDPDRNTIGVLDLQADLSSLTIFGILEDVQGYLWLSSNQGLLKAHPDSGLVNAYTESDGLQSEFYFSSCVRSDDGTMYFGGGDGYNVFHPDSIKNNRHVPPIVFTGLSINYREVPMGEDASGRTILNHSLLETDELSLNYSDKVITFTFAALNFSASHKNQYAYKMVGYDEDWIDAGFNNSAQYMNLPAGAYTFHIRGSNNDGIWNMEGASIHVSIAPPFGKTWWFKTLGVVSLFSFILAYIQLRTYRLVAQRDKLEALVRERTAQLKVEIEERQRVELEKTELKLDHLKRELLTQSLHLNDRQQIMDSLQGELESFSVLSWSEVKPRIKKLLRFLRDRSSFKRGWEEFEIWFTEIHTGFYSALRRNHPELSENELKVCALLRLNLISKDIAKVMNVQPASIDIYRHRIRKKLEIGSEENLSTFLSKY